MNILAPIKIGLRKGWLGKKFPLHSHNKYCSGRTSDREKYWKVLKKKAENNRKSEKNTCPKKTRR